MGNHEYCEECGMSSFHYGEPCPPERKAKHQEKERIREARIARLDKRANEVAEELKKLGYPAKINIYGHVVIEKWSLDEETIP